MSRFQPNLRYDQVLVLIRIDAFHGLQPRPREAVTVTKVVWTERDAEMEVDRLNRLNAGKRCASFW